MEIREIHFFFFLAARFYLAFRHSSIKFGRLEKCSRRKDARFEIYEILPRKRRDAARVISLLLRHHVDQVRVQLIERKREKARKFHRSRSLKSKTEEQTEDAMNRDAKRKRRDDEETSSSFKNERIFDSLYRTCICIYRKFRTGRTAKIAVARKYFDSKYSRPKEES